MVLVVFGLVQDYQFTCQNRKVHDVRHDDRVFFLTGEGQLGAKIGINFVAFVR